MRGGSRGMLCCQSVYNLKKHGGERELERCQIA